MKKTRTLEQMLIAYFVWGVIAYVILFEFGWINIPFVLMITVFGCIIKDIADWRGATSYGHPYFEHFPYVALVAFCGIIGNHSFGHYQ